MAKSNTATPFNPDALPPELMVEGQQPPGTNQPPESGATPPNPNEDGGDGENNDDDDEAQDEDPEVENETLQVVVLRGFTIHHNGKKYTETNAVTLPLDDANRLIELGWVADINQIRQQVEASEEVTVTVSDGVKIYRG